LNGYIQTEKIPYRFDYIVRIRDIESDEIIDDWESSIVVESSKKNPYEDFWQVATDMRKAYVKNYPQHSYYIEALFWGEEE